MHPQVKHINLSMRSACKYARQFSNILKKNYLGTKILPGPFKRLDTTIGSRAIPVLACELNFALAIWTSENQIRNSTPRVEKSSLGTIFSGSRRRARAQCMSQRINPQGDRSYPSRFTSATPETSAPLLFSRNVNPSIIDINKNGTHNVQ